ncbi:MAG TPA: 7-cyano-7-deazaguanine synthase, partial [Elusimicrobiota bacterium]|nr:7-cyano-7-deazaguanine synthase [Elusimicrobiota bacterium]
RRYLGVLGHRRIRPLQILSLPMNDVYGSHWATGRRPAPDARSRDAAVYLPGRNLTLTVKAAVYCVMNHIPSLALGTLGGNPFPDARRSFMSDWARALGDGMAARLAIVMPYRSLAKSDIIGRAGTLPLHLSFSCIQPRGRRHCGRCNKCAERQKAFREAGVMDKTTYAKRSIL